MRRSVTSLRLPLTSLQLASGDSGASISWKPCRSDWRSSATKPGCRRTASPSDRWSSCRGRRGDQAQTAYRPCSRPEPRPIAPVAAGRWRPARRARRARRGRRVGSHRARRPMAGERYARRRRRRPSAARLARDDRPPRASAAAAERGAQVRPRPAHLWLDRYIFPLERAYAYAAMSRGLGFPHVRRGEGDGHGLRRRRPDSTDAAFAAAEAHGIGAVIGKVMMDRGASTPRSSRTRSSRPTCASPTSLLGAGTADGDRLRYAFRPGSRSKTRRACWKSWPALAGHPRGVSANTLSEDDSEIASGAAVPGPHGYLDVYDRAGALKENGPILAHAIHPVASRGRAPGWVARGPLPPRRTCSSRAG